MKMTREQSENREIASYIMMKLEHRTKGVSLKDIRYSVVSRFVGARMGYITKGKARILNGRTDAILKTMEQRGYVTRNGFEYMGTEAGFYSLKKWRAIQNVHNRHIAYRPAMFTIMEWFGYEKTEENEWGMSEYEMIESIKCYPETQQEQLKRALEILERHEILVNKDEMYSATEMIEIVSEWDE